MKTSYTCRDARCPKCHKQLTGASDPIGKAEPSPDDISVCAYCGALLTFNNDLTVREASRDDLASLSPELAWKLGLIVGAVRLGMRKQQAQ